MEMGVVGNDDFTTGFRLAGVRITYDTAAAGAEQAVESALQNKEIGILVMHEDDMKSLSNRMKKNLEKLITPVIITISEKERGEDLRMLIKRTVGVDLWK